jgi:hypothetical protein
MIVKHLKYMLASPGMLLIWIFLIFHTLLCSIAWIGIDNNGFKNVWKEFFIFTKDFWTK